MCVSTLLQKVFLWNELDLNFQHLGFRPVPLTTKQQLKKKKRIKIFKKSVSKVYVVKHQPIKYTTDQ